MICEHIFAAAADDYNHEYDDVDDIDDDGKLFMHDCVYRDFGECDDHRHAAMCQFALWRIFLYCFRCVFFYCDCLMNVCMHVHVHKLCMVWRNEVWW